MPLVMLGANKKELFSSVLFHLCNTSDHMKQCILASNPFEALAALGVCSS